MDNKKYSILIVDDDRANISVLKTILYTDYVVYAANNGQDAIEIAREFTPSVILLDIVMAGIDGYAVITDLKNNEKTKAIPVIFVTGLDSTDSEEKGLLLGAADYIRKPFKTAIVKLRVQNQIKIIERNLIERDLNIELKLKEELTEAKRIAEHQREIAEQSSQVKSQFLSRMSHEMRTPMTAIMGMVQIAQLQGNIPDEVDMCLGEIDKASHHLLGIINDILDISSMEYSGFKLTEAAFDTVVFFDAISKTASESAAAKEQKFFAKLDPAVPQRLIGDANRLEQVINNLLSNAFKFTPEKGIINLDINLLEENKESVSLKIIVTDNGVGIAQEKQKGLFDAFEQCDDSATRTHGGIGLGLALSKRIVEKIDGEICVVSEPNKGAEFSFTCKLKKEVTT
ncbi:MAG: ATP-binding protein [Oscillospiraceae bacterium]|nr:ATP-binding protein [Oscillospiraceae bacterium]